MQAKGDQQGGFRGGNAFGKTRKVRFLETPFPQSVRTAGSRLGLRCGGCCGSAHKFRGDGFSPETATFLVGVEQVGHQIPPQGMTVCLQVKRREVAANDGGAILQGGDKLIDFLIDDAFGVVFVGSSGEDVQDGNPCLRAMLGKIIDDGADPFKGIFRFRVEIVAGIIGADHQLDAFGGDNVPIDAGDTPQHILRPVAAETEIECIAEIVILKVGGEDVPVVRDGVAQQHSVILTVGQGFFLLQTHFPPLKMLAVGGDDGRILRCCLRRFLRREPEEWQKEGQKKRQFFHGMIPLCGAGKVYSM